MGIFGANPDGTRRGSGFHWWIIIAFVLYASRIQRLQELMLKALAMRQKYCGAGAAPAQ